MTDEKRRSFIRMASVTAAIPVSAVIGSRFATAADMPMVDAASAQAVALSYVAESATDGQMCSNCALFQAEAGAEDGACPLFQGSSVGAASWCSAWVVKS